MAGPPRAEADARRAVRSALADLAPGALVLVACSGGADSLALAAATAFVAPRAGLRAGAVIVDHGLLPGSDEVARGAAVQCRELGLDPVTVRRVEVSGSAAGDSAGPEAAARTARYGALADVARETGATTVLLGHTLDDQAETVLLGLARGSGARSLAGMASVRGIYRRPLLGLRREDTEAVCAAAGLEFWTDPTNGVSGANGVPGASGVPGTTGGTRTADLPRRSQVRAVVLPVLEDVLGPGIAKALARSADQLRDDADLLDELAADLLGRARAVPDGDPAPDGAPAPLGAPGDVAVVLDTQALAEAPPALRRRALRAAAVEAGSPAGSLFGGHVESLDALVLRWRGQGAAHLPGGIRAWRAYGRLFLGPDLRTGGPPSPRKTPSDTPRIQE